MLRNLLTARNEASCERVGHRSHHFPYKRTTSALAEVAIGRLCLFVLGTGPLCLIGIMARLDLSTDPNPNPIGFGMLAALTIWPSVGLIVYGVIIAVWRRN